MKAMFTNGIPSKYIGKSEWKGRGEGSRKEEMIEKSVYAKDVYFGSACSSLKACVRYPGVIGLYRISGYLCKISRNNRVAPDIRIHV